MTDKRSQTMQMILSLVVAAVIVILAIAWTTSQIPLDRLPREQKEELQKDAEDRRDDSRDAREDALDEDNSGSGG
jgi:uncharacterized membrane protein YqjE